MTALDRPDRLIMLLHFADGLTPVEIAAVIRRPDGWVRARLARLTSAARAVMAEPVPA